MICEHEEVYKSLYSRKQVVTYVVGHLMASPGLAEPSEDGGDYELHFKGTCATCSHVLVSA